jgi:predicted alpha/beta-fold hydrolase
MRPFEPLFRNPHILTILGNFWPRKFDFSRFPGESRLVRTDSSTKVLVRTEHPDREPLGEVVLLHGLEGGGDSGYIVSIAHRSLSAGFITHRFHMRTCGGTEAHTNTLYHAGLTCDLRSFLELLASPLPVFLAGFSLGGNVALKLAGELGETDLIHGVCGISTPIDLGAAARRIGQPDNNLYHRRFVKRMKARLIATGRYQEADFAGLESVYAIDDRITAPSFGFGTADRYYETQSAIQFLERIRVPALLIQSKDDTFIPYSCYESPVITANPHVRLLATEHGGHLGFLSRQAPRFWADEAAIAHFTAIAARSGAVTLPSA